MGRIGWTLLWIVAGGMGPAGCLNEPAYTCQSTASCFLDGVQGECHFQTNTCIYPASDCPSNFKDGSGACFPADETSSTGIEPATTDESSDTSTTPSTSSGSTSTTDTGQTTRASDAVTTESTLTSDPDSTTSTSSSTSGSTGCGDELQNLTDQGLVGASTVFSGYPAAGAVDGDLTTSWFSTGPEGRNNGPSVYTWTAGQELCIARITVDNNAMHQMPNFREGYGFESVRVRVFNDSNQLLFEESVPLPGTPDPRVVVEPDAVIGSRIVLELSGHEDTSCGGFSELQVLGS